MLFDPAAHELLAAEPWNAERVRAVARDVVADTDTAYDPAEGHWPLHPLDSGDDDDDWAGVSHGIYLGAAGTLLALDRLARAGVAESSIDLRAAATGLHDGYLRRCHVPDEPMPSLMIGEAGIQLAAEVIAPDPARHVALLEVVRANAGNETLELLYGAPGTMLVARALHRRTGEERWAAAWRESAEALLREWQFDDELGCHLWVQRFAGRVSPLLGAAHGFAGNVLALLDGLELLPTGERDDVVRRAARTTLATAVAAGGLANWPATAGGATLGEPGTRTQWCHGAPGMVSSLAALPADPELDAILAAGAELTWQAGPLAKGAGLCHGTAGNGFAFLALFSRTGDELWLTRARAFAMHALAQVEQERRRYGRGRFGLWTGDLGAVLYAAQCVAGDAAIPTLSAW